MKGHKQEVRPGVWKFRVYAGKDPKTGRKLQVTRTFRGTEDEADQALADLCLEVRAKRVSPHRAGSVAELIDRWLEVAQLAPATRVDYLSAINNHIIPNVGDLDIAKLRPADLDLYYSRLARQVGPARVRRCHNILSAAFGQAVRWREIASNPCRDARPPVVERAEIDPPEPQQVARLLELAAKQWPAFLPYAYVVAATGARRAEVCGLQWRDVDLAGRSLTIARSIVAVPGALLIEPTKTRRVRRIGLDEATVTVLRAHRQWAMEHAMAWGMGFDDEAFVFHAEKDNRRPWRPDVVSHQFGRLRDAAGLPSVTIRQLRHFVATNLLGDGVDAVTVAGRLGHSRPSTTTDVYAHFLPVKDRAAADVIGRLLSGS